MKKTLFISIFVMYLAVATIPNTAQAATRAEMLQQIEMLTKLVVLLQEQLNASKTTNSKSTTTISPKVEKGIYYIESGDVFVDRTTKIAKAKLMFGMSDYITVETTYTDEKNILTDVLVAVRKIRPTAQYVKESSILIHIDGLPLTESPSTVVRKIITGLRSSAEIYYNSSEYSYAGLCSSPTLTNALDQAVTAVRGVNYSAKLHGVDSYVAQNNMKVSSTAVCHDDDNAYVVAAPLETGNGFWCVDSTGVSKQISISPAANSYWCSN